MALAAMLFSGCSKGEGDKVPVDRIEVSLTEQVLLPGQGQQPCRVGPLGHLVGAPLDGPHHLGAHKFCRDLHLRVPP